MSLPAITSVSVIGLGYIGLPTAAILASRKVRVVGVDTNPSVVETICQGKIHIAEPELDIIVRAAAAEGLLRATTTPEPADAFLIAVPTPLIPDSTHSSNGIPGPSVTDRPATEPWGKDEKTSPEEKVPDLGFVRAAVASIAPHLTEGNLIILESTSPVGTTWEMASWLSAARPDLRFPVENDTRNDTDPLDIHIAYCPERVMPGQVIRELVENRRIIGGLTPACSRLAAEFYRIFVRGELLETDARTAEMCKLTENAFRDVNIAFANELSLICDRLGLDVWALIELANHHPRVNILQPGCGVGGHCIAVDPWFIAHKTPADARLIRTARNVNDDKPQHILQKIMTVIGKLREEGREEEDINVALLGLTFKPNIDDLRESPALHIAEQLTSHTQANLLVVEPNISTLPPSLAHAPLTNLDEALNIAHVVVILVGHQMFQGVGSRILAGREVIDAVGIG